MTGEAGAEGTRARLLAAAALEIRQIGPKRLTISGIAGRIGLSHTAVYRHFEGKPALFDALLTCWLRPLETRLREIADGPDPADDKLERFLTTLARAYFETMRADPPLFHLLAEPEDGMREGERHHRRVEAWLERIAEEGIATRIFAGGEARRLVVLACDLAFRFIDPGAIWRAGSGNTLGEGRQDRVIRTVIRAMTGRR
jgi:AcrR family transcriptional regulator